MSKKVESDSAMLLSALSEFKRKAQEGLFEFSFRYEQLYQGMSPEDREEARKIFRSLECAFYASKSKCKKVEG